MKLALFLTLLLGVLAFIIHLRLNAQNTEAVNHIIDVFGGLMLLVIVGGAVALHRERKNS